jgi:hypothetical protein
MFIDSRRAGFALRVVAAAIFSFGLPGAITSPASAGETTETMTSGRGAPVKFKKPGFSVRVSPRMAFSPVSVLAIAELSGGDDHEDYYCLGVEWDWDDGSKSVHDADCEPYKEGAKIERRFTAEHNYSRAGSFNVRARLLNGARVVASNSFRLTVRQGVPSGRHQ